MKKLLVLAAVLGITFSFSSVAHAGQAKAVFGPQSFERTVGGPDTFRSGFEACDPAGSFKVVVINGDENGSHRASSGAVYINGMPVVVQSDFNQRVGRIERPVYGIMKSNTIDVRLQSSPGARLTISVEGVMNCLEVHITSPSNGSAINDYGMIVRGAIEAQDGAEVGVTVNGIPAEVSGKSFALAGLPLVEGENTIAVKATDDSGNSAEDSIKVTLTNPAVSPVYLSAYPTAGQAPLEVKFTVDDTIPKAKSLYELDYEGDGIVDVSAQQLSYIMSDNAHIFDAEGLYFPTLTVTDESGEKYFKTIVVNVFRMPDLKAKWDSMRSGIEAGDIEGAVKYFSLSTRDAYRQSFQALADAGALADAVARMGDVQIVKTMGNAAEGDMRVIEDGKEYSFYVLFIKDEDGIWRIKSF